MCAMIDIQGNTSKHFKIIQLKMIKNTNKYYLWRWGVAHCRGSQGFQPLQHTTTDGIMSWMGQDAQRTSRQPLIWHLSAAAILANLVAAAAGGTPGCQMKE